MIGLEAAIVSFFGLARLLVILLDLGFYRLSRFYLIISRVYLAGALANLSIKDCSFSDKGRRTFFGASLSIGAESRRLIAFLDYFIDFFIYLLPSPTLSVEVTGEFTTCYVTVDFNEVVADILRLF